MPIGTIDTDEEVQPEVGGIFPVRIPTIGDLTEESFGVV